VSEERISNPNTLVLDVKNLILTDPVKLGPRDAIHVEATITWLRIIQRDSYVSNARNLAIFRVIAHSRGR